MPVSSPDRADRATLRSIAGLSAAEVAARTARGEVNDVRLPGSRPIKEILRANFFTRFNALLGALLVVMLMVGPLQDALFGLVLLANLVIGISQELRAKLTLDRLAVLKTVRASVVRSGTCHELPVSQLVVDDCIELHRGEQVPVDGVALAAQGLEVDESLLTGEAQPVSKQAGDQVLSGSFVTAGSGIFRATAVGARSYARGLAEEARRFSLVRSELRDGINRILRVITWIIPPTAVLLVVSQLRSNDRLVDAIRGAVAGMVTLVPEGLVLLTSLALAVAVVRLARRRALVSDLSAVEGLARVDVLCLDKTGTLTEGEMMLESVELIDSGVTQPEIAGALASLAALDEGRTASLRAVASAYPTATWTVQNRVPFSSARKWSAIGTAVATWFLGAPDVVGGRQAEILTQTERYAAAGRRVLLLSRGPAGFAGAELPLALRPSAFVLLEERIRPDAAQTLEYFARQGIAIKVISGDHPATVAAVASRVGVPGQGTPADGRSLPADRDQLAQILEEHSVYGRITPHQKREMVAALKSHGHVVAMTGDGVNDVLALKEADIGIAMGSGSAATRAVAQVVLLADEFAVLPSVVAEGRRVIANIERLANLFVTKTVYAFLLALTIGVMALPFPFLPRHLTLVGSLSIGIPAFFLALAPNERRARRGFVNRVLRFSIPAGLVAAGATFGAYALVLDSPLASFSEAQTMATIVLVGTGLWLLSVLARPFNPWKIVLIGTMVAACVLVLAMPATRRFFALDIPSPLVTLAALGIVALAGTVIEVGWRLSRWEAQVRGHRDAGD
ncbi:MAG TPA: HAD-IC family P-type ATPase [Candidatus Sulfotelmatobacter sp.]|nr:HAD-IC family P-type ATPase [Candidatus Sulfotelmatobacter sp.]